MLLKGTGPTGLAEVRAQPLDTAITPDLIAATAVIRPGATLTEGEPAVQREAAGVHIEPPHQGVPHIQDLHHLAGLQVIAVQPGQVVRGLPDIAAPAEVHPEVPDTEVRADRPEALVAIEVQADHIDLPVAAGLVEVVPVEDVPEEDAADNKS